MTRAPTRAERELRLDGLNDAMQHLARAALALASVDEVMPPQAQAETLALIAAAQARMTDLAVLTMSKMLEQDAWAQERRVSL